MPSPSFPRIALAATLAVASLPALADSIIGTPADRAAMAAATGQTLNHAEDFESPVVGLDVSVPLFSQNGVSYATVYGAPLVVEGAGGFNFASPFTPLPSSVLTNNGQDNFRMSFDVPAAAVLMDVYTNGLGPTTLTFLDNGGTSTVVTLGGNSGAPAQLYSVAYWEPGRTIVSVDFLDTLGERINGGIDNLAWASAAPVPEPGSPLLLAAGLVALGVRSYRARKAD
jgi:hypothetical protein